MLTIRSDRRFHPPYGLHGGAPGGSSSNVLVSADGQREIPGMPMSAITVTRGDTYCHISAGGGGFGTPLDRDPASVLDDVLDGKVGLAAARDLYGVVLSADPPAVDAAAHGGAAGLAALAGRLSPTPATS